MIRYLLVATGETASGYSRLADYIPKSMFIAAQRREPRGFVERVIVRALSSLAVSRWYRVDSLNVEARAWWQVRNRFTGLVHFLWAERDWGFFDRLPTRSRPALCATFHSCPDTLPEVVRDVRRLQNLDAIILMSEVQRPFFEMAGVPSERIHVIHHGVDCERFSPAWQCRSQSFTVLCVGSYRRKFALLQRICQMLEQYNDIRFKIVAPKEKCGAFENMQNVTIVSGLNDDELVACYRQASCLLMTVECATANNAIVEALACGVPIVSENIGGIAEYTGTDSALLCEPGSVEGLTTAILTLYEQREQAEKMGRFARQRGKELEWPLVATRTVRVYEQILSDFARSRRGLPHSP